MTTNPCYTQRVQRMEIKKEKFITIFSIWLLINVQRVVTVLFFVVG